MPITRTAIIDDDGSGRTGTVIDNAWKQEFYNQIDALGGGAYGGLWTPVAYNAANYTAQSGAWTLSGAGVQEVFQWTILGGKTVLVLFRLGGTMTISASTASLYLALPAPIPAHSVNASIPFQYYLPGNTGTGYIELQPGKMRLLRDAGGTPFTAQTAAGYIQGTFLYPTY